MALKKTPSKRSSSTGAAKQKTAKAAPKETARKARTRKTPALPTAGPIAYPMSDEEIAQKAYALWESRGKPLGSPDEDWHRAKEQLR